MELIWLIVFIVMLVGELMTTALVSVWFCGGAICAYIASCFGVDLTVQLFVFVQSSFILLILTRPFAKKILNKNKLVTNADSIIEKVVNVTERIDNYNNTGAVFADGKIWTARSADGEIIDENTKVKIKSIQGVKVIVSVYKGEMGKKTETETKAITE